MVQQVKHPDAAEANLGKPGELLSLDVASYAAGLASGNENGESGELRVSDTGWDESRPHTLAVLSPIETLREIEAWIAAQDALTRTNHRVLVELQAARADAEARADNLALELEVAQQALHTALCRANDAEMAMALLTGPDEGEFAWHEVSTRVNQVANDDAQLVLPITAEERAAEKSKPAKKAAPKRPAPVVTEDDGQGSLF